MRKNKYLPFAASLSLILLAAGSGLSPFEREASLNTSLNALKSRVIVGGTVIDGSGRRGVRASVRIEGDRITRVGRVKPLPGEEVIDARGMIVAPGFVDIHNHSEEGLDVDTSAVNQVSQGITTLALGADGSSPWPISDYFDRRDRRPSAVNVLLFVGHATLRQKVMGSDLSRVASASEVAEMARLVEQGMREGAVGLSTGLEYDAGRMSTTEEIIELARAAARHRGLYMSHMRDEEEGMLDALNEAIRIGREARIPVQISHIKMGNVNVWGKSKEAVALINSARRSGLDITADCYPYTAWASTITILVPSRRHDDRAEVEKGLRNVGGAANVLITNCKAHLDYEGKNLEEIARERGTSPVDVYQQIVRDGGASVVCSSMSEGDVRTFYRQPWVMVSSDGGIGGRHPRSAGTFPRVLGRFVRERRWLAMEEAVRRMTSAPAARLGLKDRGLIREGMKADLVIFDPKRVIDRSTFKEPHLLSTGIERVFVNGEAVWEDGKATGRFPGLALRRQP
ncbi:MAG TPA: D-aminoacylase [Blastocatellia bacterium]|nr:D-aminoacylase [Blastocatellia bacterium]